MKPGTLASIKVRSRAVGVPIWGKRRRDVPRYDFFWPPILVDIITLMRHATDQLFISFLFFTISISTSCGNSVRPIFVQLWISSVPLPSIHRPAKRQAGSRSISSCIQVLAPKLALFLTPRRMSIPVGTVSASSLFPSPCASAVAALRRLVIPMHRALSSALPPSACSVRPN